ncbi:MAG: pilus assembly protein [Pirellulaceae bacterium]
METLQLIIALPLLVIVLFAAFQYGVLVLVQGAVTHAATVGAREAGKGVDTPTIVAAVNEVLSVHGIAIGPDATVIVERPIVPDDVVGGLPCNAPAAPLLGPDDVRVTVCVDLTTAPLLNCLTAFDLGLDFTGKRFEISSVSSLE